LASAALGVTVEPGMHRIVVAPARVGCRRCQLATTHALRFEQGPFGAASRFVRLQGGAPLLAPTPENRFAHSPPTFEQLKQLLPPALLRRTHNLALDGRAFFLALERGALLLIESAQPPALQSAPRGQTRAQFFVGDPPVLHP